MTQTLQKLSDAGNVINQKLPRKIRKQHQQLAFNNLHPKEKIIHKKEYQRVK